MAVFCHFHRPEIAVAILFCNQGAAGSIPATGTILSSRPRPRAGNPARVTGVGQDQ